MFVNGIYIYCPICLIVAHYQAMTTHSLHHSLTLVHSLTHSLTHFLPLYFSFHSLSLFLQEHQETIADIREASELQGKSIAIALDTKGPEIRTGAMKGV